MPRKTNAVEDHRSTQRKAPEDQVLKCPHCTRWFSKVGSYRKHIRSHPEQVQAPPRSPPTKLLSRRSVDATVGVYDFATILEDAQDEISFRQEDDSDTDTFYSDRGHDSPRKSNKMDTSRSTSEDINSSDDSDEDDSMYSSVNDDDGSNYDDDDNDDADNDDDDGDNADADADDNEILIDGRSCDYFTPPPVDDDDVPYSENIYPPIGNFTPASSFTTQLRLQELVYRNRGSLKMYDEIIKIINDYTSQSDFSPYDKLLPRKAFHDRLEEIFETKNFRPTYGTVRLHNDVMATVPVFDMRAMILSIVHDDTLMKEENFAEGLDIFTGHSDTNCNANDLYGEIHTGDAWQPAVERFCGCDGKYMPFGIVIFADKSHSDLHGVLSLTPITFTATFFNRTVRNNPDCWRPMAYLPNLSFGNSDDDAVDKVEDEHRCIAFGLKSLIEVSEEGGIKTKVMGREVIIKPFIHFFIGDTEGHNKWLGHYQGSKPGISRPYRDCHCSFEELSSPEPNCTYTKASEFRRALRLIVRNSDSNDAKSKQYKKDGLKMLKKQSRHFVHNALYQTKLPLSNNEHGANKMCPPESLHVMDAGITVYMVESLKYRVPGGRTVVELNTQHERMFNRMRRQSMRDVPRGSVRNGLLETTRCQSSERKGNMFLLLCIAETADGELILRHELNYTTNHWKQWKELLKLYLSMEEWFHDARSKEEVDRARAVVSDVITKIKFYFPRTMDSQGYNIPKMHALAKMIDYIVLFGSAMNFYGGPGEASHKSFVKAPGLKTQRRVCEFASQVADQYYNMMVARKACKYVDIRMANERIRDNNRQYVGEEVREVGESSVEGAYTVDVYPNGTVNLLCRRNRHLKKHGLDDTFIGVLRRIDHSHDDDDESEGCVSINATHRYHGYTKAKVVANDGQVATYNAHPHFHGGAWYDWAYVYYEIDEEDGTSTAQYFPSKILGFIRDDDDQVHAVVQCSVEQVLWRDVEANFIVKFVLCTDPGKEYTVPLSALVQPICVVPDYGSSVNNRYMLILPKGEWSGYFAQIVNTLI